MKNKEVEEAFTMEEHLGELRRRIITSVLAMLVTTIISYNYAERIAADIIARAPGMDFIYISPAELMLSYIKIAVICGFVLASPIIISQIWLFISPGLEKKQQRYVRISVFMGVGFFIVGALFSYEMVLPIIFKFFASFQTPDIKATISVASYLDFITRIILSFGIVFELPIFMYILSKFGLVDYKFFAKNRKYTVLLVFIVAAVLTPPDVISQIMLALPMLVLYEVGIVLSRLAGKKKTS